MTLEQEKKIAVDESVNGETKTNETVADGVAVNSVDKVEDRTNADQCIANPTDDTKDSDSKEESDDDDDESQSDDEGDDDDDGLTADELTTMGLEAMKDPGMDVDFAVNKFSRALEKRLQELDDELHPSLGTSYLNYGNALQVKEEQSSELFAFTRNTEGKVTGVDEKPTFSVSLGGDSTNLREDVTDEQLAWENLDLARVVLTRALERAVRQATSAQPTEGGGGSAQLSAVCTNTPTTDAPCSVPPQGIQLSSGVVPQLVEDLTFAHIRLGDIHMLAERFTEAMEEFEVAANLRQKYQLPYTALESVMISLAQAQLFSVRPQEALQSFKRAKNLIEDHLNGVEGYVLPEDSSKRKDYEMTLEDLNVQITDITKGIAEGLYKQQPPSQSSDLPSAAGAPQASASRRADALRMSGVDKSYSNDSGTTTGFSCPMLPDATVVDLGVVSNKQKIQQEVPTSDKKENTGAVQTGEGVDECEKRSKRRRIVPKSMEG